MGFHTSTKSKGKVKNEKCNLRKKKRAEISFRLLFLLWQRNTAKVFIHSANCCRVFIVVCLLIIKERV